VTTERFEDHQRQVMTQIQNDKASSSLKRDCVKDRSHFQAEIDRIDAKIQIQIIRINKLDQFNLDN
jgi:hypothetical protein